jgi:vacuolar-type H+-ATPase subunit B/Vma2
VNDNDILQQISKLVEEEHHLLRQEESGELVDPGNERMRTLEETLDQCWDLLRQRRARRDIGENPDEAHTRSKATVEGYLQ